VPEPDDPLRPPHQRDRDRIVHSTAFRRLVYKTQVFVNHEGDLFRTRLTHSLEVAQLGRSMARSLGLNEDLVEAIALAHDLGHTPFGHAGQDALAQAMQPHADRWGAFEHNLQSLRVVDRLEARYAAFDGLNLTLETREGILKHCSPAIARELEAGEPGGPGHRVVAGLAHSLEAQLVNLADEMAYNAHDIDDGVRSGLLSAAQLQELDLYARHGAAVLAEHPGIEQRAPRRLLAETVRAMLAAQVHDLVGHTQRLLHDAAPADADAARRSGALVAHAPEMARDVAAQKRFLFQALYRHPQVQETTARARQVVAELFEAYRADPAALPDDYARTQPLERGVADYIAGMTDRYALREHARLTGRDMFGLLR
jgi:dGTPase